MTSRYRDDLLGLPEMAVVARQLWETSGLGPADMQAAILYDHFTPYVLYQLEELGFCAKGEAKDFVGDGRIEIGGALPLDTTRRPARRGLPARNERDRRRGPTRHAAHRRTRSMGSTTSS